MRKLTVKRVEPLPFARLLGTLYAVLGLLWGAVVTVLVLFNVIEQGDGILRAFGSSLVVAGFAVVIVPLLQYAIGWIIGVVAAWVYNIALGHSTGLQVDVEDK